MPCMPYIDAICKIYILYLPLQYADETINRNNYILSTNLNNLFSITSQGFVRLAGLGLDYETQTQFLLEVRGTLS